MATAHLLHVSDLHFGADHGFRTSDQSVRPGELEKDVAEAIADDLESQGIDDVAALIVSGDLMTHARWVDHGQRAAEVLGRLCERLKIERQNAFFIPGNHDYEWYSGEEGSRVRKAFEPAQAVNFGHMVHYNNFLRQFRGAEHDYALPSVHALALGSYTLKLGLLDSCRITATKFHEYGYLSLGQIKTLMRGFEANPQPQEVRVVVLHHHLSSTIPEPPNDEASVSVTLDAARLVDQSLTAGVSFILHGHQHYPCFTRLNKSGFRDGNATGLSEHDVYVLSGGSAGLKRSRLMSDVTNCYSLISLNERDATVRIRRIFPDGNDGYTHLEAGFPLTIQTRN